jgi:hypothetical protein
MSWDEIYKDMAFSPFKADFAQSRELRDAIVTLHIYAQGQAKPYEVIDALQYLEDRFGVGVGMACRSFRDAIKCEDETVRDQLCYEALQLIERYLLRNHSAPLD